MTYKLSDRLREWAQNEEMIDGAYLPHGEDCIEAADTIAALEMDARRYQFGKMYGFPTLHAAYKTPYGDGDAFWRVVVGEQEYRGDTMDAAIDAAISSMGSALFSMWMNVL